jgi:hypothetical protein
MTMKKPYNAQIISNIAGAHYVRVFFADGSSARSTAFDTIDEARAAAREAMMHGIN